MRRLSLVILLLTTAFPTRAVAATTRLSSGATLSAGPSRSFPVTEIRWSNYAGGDDPWQGIDLTVPDRDTTRNLGDSELRYYDAHLARMVEVTSFLCQRQPKLEGLAWSYTAMNGNVYMGGFKLSCRYVRDLVAAYGLRGITTVSVREEKDIWSDDPKKVRFRPYAIPMLDITGTKISQWLDLVQTIRPFFSDFYYQVESETVDFPIAGLLPKLKAKTQIPILLPSRLPDLDFGDFSQEKICWKADANGYWVYLSSSGVVCDSRSRRQFHGISGTRGHLEPPNSRRIFPRDTEREIELAKGIRGIFSEGCGTYCTSSVRWESGGVVYQVSARFGEQPILVKIANAAIAAGSR